MKKDTLATFKVPEIYLLFKILYQHYGPQHWWPAENELEVVVGAILTQNTNWQNVTKALFNLKKAGLLSVTKLKTISFRMLENYIKPAGFFRVKAKRLKAVIDYLAQSSGGNFKLLKKKPLQILRKELLGIYGVGEETADSILLYALNKPVFVVDAYTRRILLRHSLIKENWRYSQVQKLFMENLPVSTKIYNEYHALLVKVGKEYCRKLPRCKNCPVQILDKLKTEPDFLKIK
ncbi:MAG: endonuclease III domain-containing protein [candidate division WOR-3 bacterium]|nr:endonuclease III domain-containing protein [candidate division WOR-3 bacterium]MCX7757158.1 endonuclease III domain-containing protein [candidate division WOR-3 bacterium]MDW7988047.1 endonuclease III domain-containing protein [candidate division WOR-3 bacterium]